jgi:hypothetical protein
MGNRGRRQLGSVRRTVARLLLDRRSRVRAKVRREDERAASLRAGAQVVVGDLLDPGDVYRVINGCGRVCFGMSVSAGYLEATVIMVMERAPAIIRWCDLEGALRTLELDDQYSLYLGAMGIEMHA